ncbi:SWIM zinc finger domain-containing protein [Ensifer sp. BR816]|uniref:SWIM zinc finger family protein n=1 Tax=Rhizobium sp. (strain BR816) TaxID=1057002 RepID=UPI0003A02433|nr:DUF6880 family protein [Ensifer sp. BR816]
MNSASKPRFSTGALRNLVGSKVYARGEAYFRDNRVELLAVQPQRVLAQVNGTEDYRVELNGRGETIDGNCSCPAFEDRGCCKHMVATALAANAGGQGAEEDGVDAATRIRTYLQSKGVDALIDMIMDLSEFDLALFRRLDMAAAATHGDGKAIQTRMLRAIDGATHTDGYVGYREADEWAAGVAAVLDTLAGLSAAGHGALARELAERSIDRIEDALQDIDDSDGHGSELLTQARDIHLASVRVARPDPATLAQYLFEREMGGDYDTFFNAAGIYADVLGAEGLAEYRRLALVEWEKLPPRRGGGVRNRTEYVAGYGQLQRILDTVAADEGDIAARIALRTKDLSSPSNYLELADFCRRHDREDEALRWVEEGLWIFEDERQDERLVFLAADLLTKVGRGTEALQLLWRAFESPSSALYERLRQLEGEAACDKAVRLIESRFAKQDGFRFAQPDLLIEILIKENRFDTAWAAAEKYDVSVYKRQSLARASEATHPQHAVRVYAERVEELVKLGGNHNYEEAAALIARIGSWRNATEHSAYLAELKAQHNRKRNFMKLLE